MSEQPNNRRLARRLRRRQYRMNGQEDPANGTPRPHEGHSAQHAGHAQEAQNEPQVEQLKDQLARKQAEFENFRKRQRRDEQQHIELANSKILEALLPVLDNFDRALSNPGDSVQSLLSGLEMVRKQFVDMLAQNGLEKIEALGQTFDPNLHEAVSMEPAGEHPENQVVGVFQDGYRLKGRLLRPAMVKVAK